jgi:hypothetical protein
LLSDELHAEIKGPLGADDGIVQRDLDREPVEQRAEQDREAVRVIISRQRSSSRCRSPATSGLRAASVQKSSQSVHELRGSASASGRQLMATISSIRATAVGSSAIRRWPTAYQMLSRYLIDSVSSWSLVLK